MGENVDELIKENRELRTRLEEAEDALRAIRSGEVDALVIYTDDEERVYTLEGADTTYRMMIENIFEGVASLRMDGVILYGNQRLAKILDAPLETIVGSNLEKFIHPESSLAYQAILQIGADGIGKGEVTIQHSNGSTLPALLSLSGMERLGTRLLSLAITDLTEQKHNEEILAAEKMARSVLDQASEAIVVCDAEGRIIRASQSVKTLVQVNPLFRPFEQVFPLMIHTQDKNGGDFSLQAVLSGRSYRGVEVHLSKDENLIPQTTPEKDLLLSATPLFDENNQILGCILSFTNISELKVAERRINAEKEWFKTTLASIGDAVVTTDASGRVSFLNSIAEDLTGWTSDEASGKPIDQVLPIINERTHQPVESIFKSVMEHGRVIGLAQHSALINHQGLVIPIEDSAAPIWDQEGNILGVVMVFQDVTQKRQAEVELRNSQERLMMTTEATEIGVWDWDISTDKITWDERCRSLFDITESSLPTFSAFLQIIHPEDRPGVEEAVKTALDIRAIYKAEFRTLWPDGSVYWVYSRGQAFYSEAGEPTRMVGVVMDITDRKGIEAEIQANQARIEVQHRLIEQREQERQQIARHLHDGPVQALLGAIYSLHGLRNENITPDFGRQIDNIYNTLQEQVSELREYAGELRPPILSKFGLVKAIDAYTQKFKEKHPEISFRYKPNLNNQQISSEVSLALFRIYQESLTNIAKHSRATSVHISLDKTPSSLNLTVTDNGVGFQIPSDWVHLARQGHLGLVGIRERAEAVGGKASVQSQLAKGTQVRVIIPLERLQGTEL